MIEFKEKIILPKDAVLIQRDEALKQTSSGIILGETDPKTIHTGTIVALGGKLGLEPLDPKISLLGTRVRFKENFGEELEIEGNKYLFFRELEPSIYYYFDEKDKRYK